MINEGYVNRDCPEVHDIENFNLIAFFFKKVRSLPLKSEWYKSKYDSINMHDTARRSLKILTLLDTSS